jgi:hypothetical protein
LAITPARLPERGAKILFHHDVQTGFDRAGRSTAVIDTTNNKRIGMISY